MRIVSPRDKPPGGLCFFRREERAVPSPKGLCHQNKGFPRRTLWCRPPWRIWFSPCPTRPILFFGRRCAAARRSAPRARPESWRLARSWWSGQQRARPPAGAGSGEWAGAACVGLREAAVGALRPSGSAGSTGSRWACWTWTSGGAGGRVAGRRRAFVNHRHLARTLAY